MGEIGLPGEIAYWAGFAVGVMALYVVILIARRVKKPKKSAEADNQNALLNRRVAETIKQVEPDIPELLRPYLVYRGPVPEPLSAKWFPRELTIEAPGQEPQQVEVYQDGYGLLYARVNKTK